MHNHHHHHHGHGLAGARLRNALVLTVGILVIEVVAASLSGSLALLADAGHIVTDVFALGLAWFATRLTELPPNQRQTFGYQRSGIVAALINGTLLVIISLGIAIEAVLRLRHPQSVNGSLVVAAALVAILVNAYIAAGLRGERHDNLNIRAAFLHVVGDLAASVGVVLAGVLILLTHQYLLDPLISLAIAALITSGAWQIVRDTVAILMESTPRDVDLEALRAAMHEVPGVDDIHDLHVWALSDGFRLLTAHVAVPEQSLADAANLLDDLKLLLHRRFHIEHATIEVECIDCRTVRRRPIPLVPRGTPSAPTSSSPPGLG